MIKTPGDRFSISTLKSALIAAANVLISIAAFVFLLVKGFTSWISPTLFMDEGYYVGAALRMLHGDLFLRAYPFDKPFLHPLIEALGIYFGGETPVGFKLAATLFFFASYVQFVRLLRLQIARNENTLARFITLLTAHLVALALFAQPFMIHLGFSAFVEPILLFFCLGIGIEVTRAESHTPRVGALAWYLTLSLFTKYSALVWWLAALGLIFVKKMRWQDLKAAFQRGPLWIWIIGLTFFFTNSGAASGFIRVVWTDPLSESHHGLFDHVRDWSHQLTLDLSNQPVLSISLFVLFVAAISVATRSWLLERAHSRTSSSAQRSAFTFYCFTLPVLVHFALIFIINGSRLERCFFLFIPQALVLIVRVFARPRETSWEASSSFRRLRTVSISVGLIAVALGWVFVGSQFPVATFFEPGRLSAAWGRSFYQLNQAALTGSVAIVPDHLSWETSPWRASSRADWIPCIENNEDNCLSDARVGIPISRVFQWLHQVPEGEARITQVPLVVTTPQTAPLYAKCIRETKLQTTVPRLKEAPSINDLVLKKLRLQRDFTITELDSSHIRATSKKLVLGQTVEFEMRGSWEPFAQETNGLVRWYSAFRLASLKIKPLELELVDLAPVLYKGYILALEPIEWPYQKNETLTALMVDKYGSNYVFQVDHADFTSVCGAN